MEGGQPYLGACFAIEEKELFDTSRMISLMNRDQIALKPFVASGLVAQHSDGDVAVHEARGWAVTLHPICRYLF